MPRDSISTMAREIRRVAAKELTLFFSSPIGYLFLLTFLATTLFVFFWGERFFARNIADVRPMFEWMPLLLIFLCAALTMRMWSEERRSGTLEFVATLPASTTSFVIGKFVACGILLGIALLLTLPLPVSVSMIGNLDWGPVVAGYIAALLLGCAYLAIGLFVSARSDNQIVALIMATLVSALFYMVGSSVLTDLAGNQLGQWLRALGTGSRFASITRGVIDLRDLYYYLSIVGAFLALNVYTLERQRWAAEGSPARHRRWQLATALLVANALAPNFWLAPVHALRVDVTEGRMFSISDATRSYLTRLREPLLIRGYFSAKTHPLLAPLVPQLTDLLREYEVAGGGRVRVEIVDPQAHPEVEEEANSKYGIHPVPFQVADRYQASLVNSYFDVLVQYGDEYQVLGFRDLIEVKLRGEADLDVQLRNPEYDITRAIKKVLYEFQGGGDVYQALTDPVTVTAYVSADDRLPPALRDFRGVVEQVLREEAGKADGKLTVRWIDPDDNDGAVAREIGEQYGLRPMAASLFDADTFYFYVTLASGPDQVTLPLPDPLDADAFRRTLTTGLKRFNPGVLKTIGLVVPPPPNPYLQQPGMPGSGNQFNELRDFLSHDYKVQDEDLDDGRVAGNVDILMLADPRELDEKQLFAVDQFLMQGGTVVLATSGFETQFSQQSLLATPHRSGLEPWLASFGVSIDDSLVMDPQNAAFPIPVTRRIGGFSFQEIRMIDYPYFVDVRGDGLNADSPITADLPQVTVPWPSPIVIDAPGEDPAAGADRAVADGGRTVTPLLSSSPESWTTTSTDIMPRIDERGRPAYEPGAERAARLIGVALEGRFDSYFAGRPSPLLAAEDDAEKTDGDGGENPGSDGDAGVIGRVIDRSPESAKLVLFASNEFLDDQSLRIIGSADGTVYVNSLQMMANVVDWALEERGLLSIRSRGHFNRTLPPMERSEQVFWEVLNYALALLGVLAVWLGHQHTSSTRQARYRAWLTRNHLQGRAA